MLGEGLRVSEIEDSPYEERESDVKTVAKLGLSLVGIYCTLGAGVITVILLLIWGPHYVGILWGFMMLVAIICIVAGIYVANYSWAKAEKASSW